MKPKNKFQKRIVEAAKRLPSLSEAALTEARLKTVEHYARRTKKGVVTCMECGSIWQDRQAADSYTCPHCGMKLKTTQPRRFTTRQIEYFCLLTTHAEFQVLRYFYIEQKTKSGNPATYFHSEVLQRWIAPDGRCATLAKPRPISFYTETWCFSSPMEIRSEKSWHDIIPTHIYSRRHIIPELKRRGFGGDFCDLTPFSLFHLLLTESKAETLFKAGQASLLHYFGIHASRNIGDYWASIKICLRNGYKVEDATLWCDYIDQLRFFGKDLRNASYVCPADLSAEHDRYVQKRQKYEADKRKEEARLQALADEETYRAQKSKFFGIVFTDGMIEVRVLDSVQEVMREGDAMHHCVFANRYHLRTDCLLLSARMDGQRLETIEVSLSNFCVVQSRGVCNQSTGYHERIIELVRKNMPLIQRRTVAA